MTDEMLMRTAQLTPEYRPLVDFHSQYSTTQSQKGWRYGYTDASRSAAAPVLPDIPCKNTLSAHFVRAIFPTPKIAMARKRD